MAINNPYIPGDPYSYDLKWIVAKVKEILAQLGTLDEAIEAKIFEGFLEHSVVQFKTVPEMLAADIKDGSIVLTLGYHEAGDKGSLFYLVKDFNPGQCSLDYFLTMDNNAQIAIPVVVTPYVTPEMFGAYGNGIEDDSEAVRNALKHDNVIMTGSYLISEQMDLMSDQNVTLNGSIHFTNDLAEDFVFHADGISNFSWKGGTIKGEGAMLSDRLNLFSFDDCENIDFFDLTITDIATIWAIRFNACENVSVENCSVNHYSYGGFGCVNGCKDAIIKNCKVENLDVAGTGNGYPIMLSGGETTIFTPSENVKAIGNFVNNTAARWEGIDAHGGKNIVVSNNIVKGCVTGIAIFNSKESTYEYDCENVEISGNVCEGPSSGSTGYGISASGYHVRVHDNIVQNYAQTDESSGFYTRFSNDFIAHHNSVINCSCGYIIGDQMLGGAGYLEVSENYFYECGKYPAVTQAMTIRTIDLQKNTVIKNNVLERSRGTLRFYSTAAGTSYVKAVDNVIIDPIDGTNSGTNTIVTDLRGAAPTASNTKMGRVNDVCRLEVPVAGQPTGWICTSAWDGSTVTWTPLANL